MDVSIKPDVLGIRYEVIKNVYPVIEFHGYIVEVKKNKARTRPAHGQDDGHYRPCSNFQRMEVWHAHCKVLHRIPNRSDTS